MKLLLCLLLLVLPCSAVTELEDILLKLKQENHQQREELHRTAQELTTFQMALVQLSGDANALVAACVDLAALIPKFQVLLDTTRKQRDEAQAGEKRERAAKWKHIRGELGLGSALFAALLWIFRSPLIALLRKLIILLP